MEKLIEVSQKDLVVCDNSECNYKVPFENNNHQLIYYINKPCPACGENLLTKDDYLNSLRIEKAIEFINKWFSWLTIFNSKKNIHKATVKVHRGIQITHFK